MLEGVISSKTKINILVKLFLNPATKAYLRELASELNVSTNSVRTELNNLTEHRILVSERDGRNVYYSANTRHPLFPELSSMVRKITGIDQVARSVIERLGRLEAVYVTGDYARGKDTGIIDLVLIGDVDREQLEDVVRKTENYINRKIRPLVLSRIEYDGLVAKGSLPTSMLLWSRDTDPGDENSVETGEHLD
jgi:predicted nucleotidyltransferase